jgi:hypothetical protein
MNFLAINDLIHQFRANDIDDPELNRKLLDTLCQRFDLCADFKKLYLYSHDPVPSHQTATATDTL